MTEREKKDSTKRAYLLHRKLELGGVVHRRDLSELTKVLKPKREFTISVRYTHVSCVIMSHV